jgi:hypothetical protein
MMMRKSLNARESCQTFSHQLSLKTLVKSAYDLMDDNIRGQKESPAHKVCEERLRKAVYYNFDVLRMVYAIEELGCKLPERFFSCKPCANDHISGGFVAYGGEKDYRPAIVVCEDNLIPFRNAFESTIVHELV